MLKRKKIIRKKIKKLSVIICSIIGLFFCFFGRKEICHAEEESKRQITIDQIRINMPEITMYYAGGFNDHPHGWLGGQELECTGQEVQMENAEGIAYEIVIDSSCWLSGEQFQAMKNSLNQFQTTLRERDLLQLYILGEETKELLHGPERTEKRNQVINALEWQENQSSVLESLLSIVSRKQREQYRTVLILLSAGQQQEFSQQESELLYKAVLQSGKNIHLLLMKDQNAEALKILAGESGGAVQYPDGTGVQKALWNIQDYLLHSIRLSFLAESNFISGEEESFVFSGDTVYAEKKVLPMQYQCDLKEPEITKLEWLGENVIQISFSEKMCGEEELSHYAVRKEEIWIPILQIVKSDEEKNTVQLILGEALTNGTYALHFSEITDASMEKNHLKETGKSLEITDAEETDLYEKNSINEKEDLEKEDLGNDDLEAEARLLPDIIEGEKGNLSDKEFLILLIILVCVFLVLIFLLWMYKKKTEKNAIMLTIYHSEKREPGQPYHFPEPTTFLLKNTCIIGRSKKCNLSYEDLGLSRQHFKLKLQEDRKIRLEDLGSANGTMVNQEAICRGITLNSGDQIQAGNSVFEILWSNEKGF